MEVMSEPYASRATPPRSATASFSSAVSSSMPFHARAQVAHPQQLARPEKNARPPSPGGVTRACVQALMLITRVSAS